MHPQQSGRFVLAIECDGASYHAAPTARDRDRLRQQHLEALGWRFHRIWSTDWFLRREEEVRRILRAHEEAVRAADEADAREAERAAAPKPVEPPVATPAGEAPRQEAARDDDPADAAARLAAASRGPAPMLLPGEGAVGFDSATAGSGARPAAPPATSATPARGTRPSVPLGLSIDDYSLAQLHDVVSWVHSDGRLRTDDELLAEVMAALGFKRRGTRIVERIRSAIAAGTSGR